MTSNPHFSVIHPRGRQQQRQASVIWMRQTRGPATMQRYLVWHHIRLVPTSTTLPPLKWAAWAAWWLAPTPRQIPCQGWPPTMPPGWPPTRSTPVWHPSHMTIWALVCGCPPLVPWRPRCPVLVHPPAARWRDQYSQDCLRFTPSSLESPYPWTPCPC